MNIQIKVLSREIGEYLWRGSATLSTAESCTAGGISAAITTIPGSSSYFRGGIVAYTDDVKAQWLGVPTELLTDKGAVSEEVAVSMAQGVREKLGTDYSIAITGYAGPGGGPEAPVGTIWIAIGTPNDIQTRQLTGDEGRETNLVKATLMALEMLKARLQVDFPLEETDEE
ncbi:MAG: CinA family protein [Bacteroidaceae bacterium]|nr:CinA family protein [Bacteroidaceae bacterium]